MRQMDANKTNRKKARYELHKNAMSYLEQILKATPYETTAVQPLTSYLKNPPSKTNKKYNSYELIRDILQWTPTHWRASVGQPARTYKLSVDTGCNLKDLPVAIDNRDGWKERESGKSALSARFDDDDICLCVCELVLVFVFVFTCVCVMCVYVSMCVCVC